MTVDPRIAVQQIDALPYQQSAVSDRKAPTRYAVTIDGTKVGEVGTYSRESWATSGRIRTRMLGYERTWKLWDLSGREVSWPAATRAKAVERLVAYHFDTQGSRT